jgi:hypothetical protein
MMDLISEQQSLTSLTEKERLNLILEVRNRRRERSKPKQRSKPKRTQKMLAGLNDAQLHELLNTLRTGQ